MVALKLLEVVAKNILSSQTKAQDMVAGVVGAKKREPVQTVFKKARKKLGGEFEMAPVTSWHNETPI